MPDFSTNIMRSLMKTLNMRKPRIELWSVPLKTSIHALIADPIAFASKNNCGATSS